MLGLAGAQLLGSSGMQLGSPGSQLGSSGTQLGSSGSQLGSSINQLGSPGTQLWGPSEAQHLRSADASCFYTEFSSVPTAESVTSRSTSFHIAFSNTSLATLQITNTEAGAQAGSPLPGVQSSVVPDSSSDLATLGIDTAAAVDSGQTPNLSSLVGAHKHETQVSALGS